MSASQEFGKRLYEQASASQGGAAAGDGTTAGATGPNDDEVVDAEIVDEEAK